MPFIHKEHKGAHFHLTLQRKLHHVGLTIALGLCAIVVRDLRFPIKVRVIIAKNTDKPNITRLLANHARKLRAILYGKLAEDNGSHVFAISDHRWHDLYS